jgi:Domain of unknown function (DUF4232)
VVAGVVSVTCNHTFQADIVGRMRWIMTDRRPRGLIAVLCSVLALSAAALLIAWGSGSWSAKPDFGAPKLHLQAIGAVHVISPHLSYAREVALVPKDHYFGVLAGAVTTCGTEGVNLSPLEMARRPVTVTLWHQGALISSVRLARRAGFAFLVVGGSVVRFPYNPRTHEQSFGWSPGFTVRASNGFAGSAYLGGLGSVGEVVVQIAARPHIHPCYPDRPSLPDNNRVSVSQACVLLSASIEGHVSPATGEHAVMVAVTNGASHACQVFGYPRIVLANAMRQLPNNTLVPSSRGELPFTVVHGSPYTSNRPPSVVTLAPGGRAYVEVTKYRCDRKELRHATNLTLYVPISGQVLTVTLPPSEGVGTFSYCQGGPRDPGNLVSVSPVSASVRWLYPR